MFCCFIKKKKSVCECVFLFLCYIDFFFFFNLHIFSCGNSFILSAIIHPICLQISDLDLKIILCFIFMALLRMVTKTVFF